MQVKNMLLPMLVGLACAGGAMAGLARAEEAKAPGSEAEAKAPNTDPEAKTKVSTALSDLALAHQLIAYGERTSDPIALAQGAKILKGIPTQEKKAAKQTKGDGKEDDKSGEAVSAESALAKARELAGEQQVLLAVIEDVEKSGSRWVEGAPDGTARIIDRVRAATTDIWGVSFRGDYTAAVFLEGDGDTDLDLYIYDEYGNLICADEDYTDSAFCEWIPSWTGDFEIHVVNLGDISNQYVMYLE